MASIQSANLIQSNNMVYVQVSLLLAHSLLPPLSSTSGHLSPSSKEEQQQTQP